MTTDKEYLISEINEAFKGVELHDGIGLSEANALDDYKGDQFREECKRKDEKYYWSAIPSAFLNQYNSSLNFFDAKGMKFHLPAFMIAEINGEYNFDIVFSLTSLSDYSQSQFALLTKRQKEVVKLFLEYLMGSSNYEFEKPNMKNAIDCYWAI
jgi:hypothetical protein